MVLDLQQRALWRAFFASERPVLALLRHVRAQENRIAALNRLMAALTPSEASALMPHIEREKDFRIAWFGAELPDA